MIFFQSLAELRQPIRQNIALSLEQPRVDSLPPSTFFHIT
jgi:hypothetical protein